MNRRQEIATWVLGVVLAAACILHGADHDDFTIGVVAPLLIIGGLTVFSLRTRPAEPTPIPKRSVAAGLIVLLGLTAAGRAAARFEHLQHSLESRIQVVEASVADVDSNLDDLKSKVDELDTR